MGETDAIFERLYFHELDRHDQIVSSLRLPLTVIIALLGADLLIFRSYSTSGTPSVDLLFFVLCVVAFVLIVLASVQLFRAASGQDYKHLSDTALLDRHRAELEEWYLEYSDIDDAEVATHIEREFAEVLKAQFIECAENNFLRNNEKSDARFLTYRWIRLSLLPLTAAAIIFVLSEKIDGERVVTAINDGASDVGLNETSQATEADAPAGSSD